MKKKNVFSYMIHFIAFALILIGGLNWGLVGMFQFNLINYLFGSGTLTRWIYSIVGILSAYVIIRYIVLKIKQM